MNCKKIQKNINFLLKALKKSRPNLSFSQASDLQLFPGQWLNGQLWTISKQSLAQISHHQARETVEIILYTTVCFATAGIAVGAIGGPKGMAIGGITGAVCGMVCSSMVLCHNRDESRFVVLLPNY